MTRIWSNQTEDSGSIHCFGNGNFMVYALGPVLSQIEGPPYTMPSFGSLTFQDDQALYSEGEREAGFNIWNHNIYSAPSDAPDRQLLATFTDYMLPDRNVFIRDYTTSGPVSLKLVTPPAPAASPDFSLEGASNTTIFRDFPFGDRKMDCIMTRIPMGTNFFTNIAVEEETWLILVLEGGTITEDNTLIPGPSGRLLLSAGMLPDAVAEMTAALQMKPEQTISQVRDYWKTFFSRITDLGALLPADQVPLDLRQKVSAACESVAILIKCQQSSTGGVQAAHPGPLAYVRDTAGSMRGMLALGMYDETRKGLLFWYHRFCQFGNIHNAEGMGNHGGRLYFPNDVAEVPAYILISAFWYVEKTGDTELLNEIYPMLKWAFEVQLPYLGGGMTSFSGDETYIAGGTLPRIHTHDGSAESTLLFIESGERFLNWCRSNTPTTGPALTTEQLSEYEAIVRDARDRYKDNFCIDGLIYANNPDRLNYIKKPPFARGFCEVHDGLYHQLVLGWTIYDEKSDYYCCPECYGKPHPNPFDRKKRHQLSSASLLPAFYESSLFSVEELKKIASPYIALFEKNGFVPSNTEGTRSTGYDYGLFLYAMSVLKHPLRVPALKVMMEFLDETGAWVEYYDNHKPAHSRCRPWESGINIEAIRKLTESFQ